MLGVALVAEVLRAEHAFGIAGRLEGKELGDVFVALFRLGEVNRYLKARPVGVIGGEEDVLAEVGEQRVGHGVVQNARDFGEKGGVEHVLVPQGH